MDYEDCLEFAETHRKRRMMFYKNGGNPLMLRAARALSIDKMRLVARAAVARKNAGAKKDAREYIAMRLNKYIRQWRFAFEVMGITE